MPALREWRSYVPSSIDEGTKLPKPSRDEDEITMSYETLSRLSLLRDSTYVFVCDSSKDLDFSVVLDLLSVENPSVVTFRSVSEGLYYSLKNTPSVLTVVSSKPPAGVVSIVFNDKGRVQITKYELRKEFLGFLKTEIVDEKALSELVAEASVTTATKILSRFIKYRGVKDGHVSLVNGFIRNPRLLERVLSSLKLKKADSSIVEELRKQGYEVNLGTAVALTKIAERCSNNERIVYVGGTISEGVIILHMKCAGV
ncbi:MAG: hypothetical protein ACP5KB_01815 [Thermoprotei archaeon]